MKLHTLAAAVAATLALCGAAQAQSTSGTSTGTMSSDVNGSSTMPAEVVAPGTLGTPSSSATSTSGTSSASGLPHHTTETMIPTRNEVKVEAASMVRAGTIPRGELSTAYQDKGAQLGSTPF
ncbi:hypothetical protein [Ideonella sp. BN130291]|uniref:hypothetical protein n=1 Tax=Ideonella sp. BN130291 TaxID=3112940 RepID=UPI002E2553C5|nr:hypothetical protein [Ideonella sp. BN130291]